MGSRQREEQIPEVSAPAALIDEIKAGNCVAFVGAGFTAAAGVPGWRHLLSGMAQCGAPGRPAAIEALDEVLSMPSVPSRHLEMVAQVLYDELGDEAYRERLRRVLSRRDPLPPVMQRRLDRLTGIPFQAIVTTNFDPVLQGVIPSSEVYRRLLRPRAHRWWDQRYWPDPDTDRAAGPPVVKLHGDLSGASFREVVFTRREYRSRLYGDVGYLSTLRSLFATKTILYLGYSLSDEYLNQMRGELLYSMGMSGAVPIMAYALLPEPSPLEQTYYRHHEGIELIGYPLGPDEEHLAFDQFLDLLYEQTNPIHILGSRLQDRRILWLDPTPEWNEGGMRFLARAVQRASALTEGVEPEELFITAPTPAAAVAALDRRKADLIITRWGHASGRRRDGAACSDAEELLERLARRRADGAPAPPVIVFAGREHAALNKPDSLQAGAVAYTWTWEMLLRTIDRVLAPPDEAPGAEGEGGGVPGSALL